MECLLLSSFFSGVGGALLAIKDCRDYCWPLAEIKLSEILSSAFDWAARKLDLGSFGGRSFGCSLSLFICSAGC